MCTKRQMPTSQLKPSRLKLATFVVAIATTAAVSLTPYQSATAETHSDGKIFAIYNVTFNGLSLGKFKFRSDISDKRYSMNGNSKFSFLNGLFFEWKGSVHSSGSISKGGPKPNNFSFVSNTNGDVETLSMKFAKNAVENVIKSPNKPPSSQAIPVQERHLKSVVDPMSALMVLTAGSGANSSGREICARSIPIFDGKQRFDLHLSFKKQVRLQKNVHSGFSGKAYVCRVKYSPIAGHKPSKSGTKYLADSNDIEVWLVPVPQAKMYAPYKIVLPTIAGYATATSTVFQIDQPGGGRIAFASR